MTNAQKPTRLRPKPLDPGAVIGIAAPASPFDEDKFKKGLSVLEAMGYKTVVDQDIFSRHRFLAGTDEMRATFFNNLFGDPQIDAIMCARGGYGCMRLLDKLDYDLIRVNPKMLVGFSDISLLLAVLYDRCGLIGFHGPTVAALSDADEATLASLQKAFNSDQAPLFDLPEAKVLCEGIATGPLTGGNLSVLNHLLGTAYQPDFSGHILMFEDRIEAPYRIDRMLTQMHLAGAFDGIAGLILGQFTDCGPEADVITAFAEKFSSAGIPVMAGFEAGHGTTNLTFPIGETATLDTAARQLKFERVPASGKG